MICLTHIILDWCSTTLKEKLKEIFYSDLPSSWSLLSPTNCSIPAAFLLHMGQAACVVSTLEYPEEIASVSIWSSFENIKTFMHIDETQQPNDHI